MGASLKRPRKAKTFASSEFEIKPQTCPASTVDRTQLLIYWRVMRLCCDGRRHVWWHGGRDGRECIPLRCLPHQPRSSSAAQHKDCLRHSASARSQQLHCRQERYILHDIVNELLNCLIQDPVNMHNFLTLICLIDWLIYRLITRFFFLLNSSCLLDPRPSILMLHFKIGTQCIFTI